MPDAMGTFRIDVEIENLARGARVSYCVELRRQRLRLLTPA